MTGFDKALKLRNELKQNGFAVDLGLSNANTLFLRVLMHGRKLRHDWVSQIKKILGVTLTRNRTPTNRLTYVADMKDFRVYISTNQPYCKDATFCEIITPRKKSYYECPE